MTTPREAVPAINAEALYQAQRRAAGITKPLPYAAPFLQPEAEYQESQRRAAAAANTPRP